MASPGAAPGRLGSCGRGEALLRAVRAVCAPGELPQPSRGAADAVPACALRATAARKPPLGCCALGTVASAAVERVEAVGVALGVCWA